MNHRQQGLRLLSLRDSHQANRVQAALDLLEGGARLTDKRAAKLQGAAPTRERDAFNLELVADLRANLFP